MLISELLSEIKRKIGSSKNIKLENSKSLENT